AAQTPDRGGTGRHDANRLAFALELHLGSWLQAELVSHLLGDDDLPLGADTLCHTVSITRSADGTADAVHVDRERTGGALRQLTSVKRPDSAVESGDVVARAERLRVVESPHLLGSRAAHELHDRRLGLAERSRASVKAAQASGSGAKRVRLVR